MSFSLSEKELLWLREHEEETLSLIEALCAIPAPSGHEEKRAEFCKKWLDACGCRGVYVDSDYNTVYPIGCDGCDDITLFIAHTDTVFPDTEPMPYSRDEEYLRAPGVGDDTASVAVLLTVAKYIAKHNIETVDLGVAVISMHAPYELVSKTDVYTAHKAFYAFLKA